MAALRNTDVEYASASNPTYDCDKHGFKSIESERKDQPASRMILKKDLRVLPSLIVIYIVSFLDQVSVGNALIYHLPEDLDMHGEQVNVYLSIFFVSYVVFQMPAMQLMKRVRPPVFLSVSFFLCGLLVLVQGLVQSYGGLITTRFLKGFAEACTFPGCFYLMSMWYQRWEAQKRFTFFFISGSFTGAFSGLLASAIGKMNGIRGFSAWRWIFILEGVLTCVLSFISFFTIADFPEDAKWLTEDERVEVIARLKAEQGAPETEKAVTFRDVLHTLRNWRVFLGPCLYFSVAVSGFGLAFFIPSIIASYDYSPIQAQLHSVIPWAAGTVFSLAIAYISDKLQKRFIVIMACLVFAFAGNVLLLTIHTNRKAELAGVVMYLMGVVAASPITICWYAMNLNGHHERAVGIPWQLGLGNVSGIISTFAFPSKDAPRYTLGYSLGLGFLCFGAAVCVLYYVRCKIENQRLGRQKYVL